MRRFTEAKRAPSSRAYRRHSLFPHLVLSRPVRMDKPMKAIESMPKAILFDLDGVLVRSHEAWFRLLADASLHFGGRPVTSEEFIPLFGQGAQADVAVFGMKCTPDQLNRYFNENFDRFAQGGVWVDPEAAPTLDALSRSGLRLAIVTNTMGRLAESILRQGDLLRRFQLVTSADQVERSKPAPDLLLLAMERLGVQPGEAWMVGDSRFDREAAKAASVHFIGYQQEGDVRIDRLPELVQLLGSSTVQKSG